MSYCSNCGNKTEEGTRFCKHCGKPLEQKQVESTDEIKEEKNENIRTDEIKEEQVINEIIDKNDNSSSQAQPTEKPKKWGNKKRNIIILTTVIVVLVAFIAGTFGKNLYIRRNPETWALYSLQKNYNADTVYSTTNINLKLTKTPSYSYFAEEKNIIEDFSLRIDNKYLKKENVMRLDLSLLYKEKDIISGSIYADKDLVAVDFPELYDKPLYLNWDDINTLLKEDSNKNITAQDYKSLLEFSKSKYFDNIKKDYTTFFSDNLSDNLKKGSSSNVIVKNGSNTSSIKCEELIFTMNNSDLLELMQNLFNKIADDKNIKELVKEKYDEFLSIAQKNGDLKNLFGANADIDELRSQFNEKYDDDMKELKDNSENLDEKQDETFNIKSVYKIDSKNYIRGIDEEIETKNSNIGYKIISNTVFNTIDGKVDIEKITSKNGVNLTELSKYEQDDIFEQVSERLQYIISSKFKY